MRNITRSVKRKPSCFDTVYLHGILENRDCTVFVYLLFYLQSFLKFCLLQFLITTQILKRLRGLVQILRQAELYRGICGWLEGLFAMGQPCVFKERLRRDLGLDAFS